MDRLEKLRYSRENIVAIQEVVKTTIFDGIVKELIDLTREVLCYEATDETFNTYIFNNLVVVESDYKFDYSNNHFKDIAKDPELYKRLTEYVKENKNKSLTALVIDKAVYQIPQSLEILAYLFNRAITFLNSILTSLLHYSNNPKKMADILDIDENGKVIIKVVALANKIIS